MFDFLIFAVVLLLILFGVAKSQKADLEEKVRELEVELDRHKGTDSGKWSPEIFEAEAEPSGSMGNGPADCLSARTEEDRQESDVDDETVREMVEEVHKLELERARRERGEITQEPPKTLNAEANGIAPPNSGDDADLHGAEKPKPENRPALRRFLEELLKYAQKRARVQ